MYSNKILIRISCEGCSWAARPSRQSFVYRFLSASAEQRSAGVLFGHLCRSIVQLLEQSILLLLRDIGRCNNKATCTCITVYHRHIPAKNATHAKEYIADDTNDIYKYIGTKKADRGYRSYTQAFHLEHRKKKQKKICSKASLHLNRSKCFAIYHYVSFTTDLQVWQTRDLWRKVESIARFTQ